MHDPIALAAELKRIRQELRDTQRDLGEERQQNERLRGRLEAAQARHEALLIHEAITRIPAQPPDPDGGLCEPILYEKPIRDAGSIDNWQEAEA